MHRSPRSYFCSSNGMCSSNSNCVGKPQRVVLGKYHTTKRGSSPPRRRHVPDARLISQRNGFEFWCHSCIYIGPCLWSAFSSKCGIWGLRSNRLCRFSAGVCKTSVPCNLLILQVLPTTGTATSFSFGAQPAASNAFGQAPAAQGFGQPASPQPTGGFGFGQPQSAASTGFGFGQSQTAGSSGFVQPQTPAVGGFGQAQTPGIGGFSQPQSAASTGFGQPQSAASTGFGQPQSAAASSSFGFNQASASPGVGLGTAQLSPAMFGQTQAAATSAQPAPAFGVTPGQATPGDFAGCAHATDKAFHQACCLKRQDHWKHLLANKD